MIRYATAEDAAWITALQEVNPSVVVNPIRGEELLNHINGKNIIISESDDGSERYSFMLFTLADTQVDSRLILTEEAHRRCGHASELYQYLFAKYQKPIRYFVEAGSESEQIWAKRSDRVEQNTEFVGGLKNNAGTAFNEYKANGLPNG